LEKGYFEMGGFELNEDACLGDEFKELWLLGLGNKAASTCELARKECAHVAQHIVCVHERFACRLGQHDACTPNVPAKFFNQLIISSQHQRGGGSMGVRTHAAAASR